MSEFPAYVALSGRLSATFNLDGQHLARFVARRSELLDELYEDLLLHDQIRIPTSDYLTAAGLVICLGEDVVIRLLKDNALRFSRLRGNLGYVRGKARDGSLVVVDGKDRDGTAKPQSADLEHAVDSGIAAIHGRLERRSELKDLIIRQTDELLWLDALHAVRLESHRDLKATNLWRESYGSSDLQTLYLPGSKKMQVHFLGPQEDTDVEKNAIHRLLALTLWNAEFHLARKFACSSLSSSSPLGSILEKKSERAYGRENAGALLMHLCEISKVPWLASTVFDDAKAFDQFMGMRWAGDGRSFRQWFHEARSLSEKEFTARYIELLTKVPTASTKVGKAIRFVITSVLKGIPVVGTVASFMDKFFVDSLARMPSPKFFVNDLKKFGGKLVK